MEQNYQKFILDAVLSGGLAFVLVYIFGIIWRTERRIDLSYKFYAISVSSLLASKLVGLFFRGQKTAFFFQEGLEILFVIFLLLGVLEMRYLIRKIDGEK